MKMIYETILESDGIIEQSEIVEKTDCQRQMSAEVWICWKAKDWQSEEGEEREKWYC